MSRRLLASYLTLTIVVLLALEVPLAIQFSRSERRDLTARVERDAGAFASLAEDALQTNRPTRAQLAALRRVGTSYAKRTGGRVVLVDRRGRSLLDTSPPAPGPRDFSTRPEIAAALGGSVSTGTRYSQTLRTGLLYVALPVASGGVVHGAVRVTYPTSTLDARVRRYRLALAAIALVVLAVAALVGVAFARSIVGPLRALQRAATAAGHGDLGARAPVAGPPEVRSLATDFNEMVARLDGLVRSQEAFVADASHQLRTPLTALRLRLENLEYDIPPERRGELEATLAETARLARLVDGLLELARADASPAPAEPVRLVAAAEERLGAWRALAEERDVSLRQEIDGKLVVRAAPGRLAQVLDNLLANALEVAPPESAITVGAERRDGWVDVHVVDAGPGMSEEERAHAFDRFWRARRGGEGSGLGLAIVRRLAEADGGRVELRAAPGGGLDVVVSLRAERHA